MAALTDFLENALLNAVLRATAYTPPAAVYVALFTSATTEGGGGGEVSGGSYARQAVTFGAPSNGVCSNTGSVVFNNMPAAVVTHVAIMDASSAGNMLFHGPLATQRTTALADSVTFGVGALSAALA